MDPLAKRKLGSADLHVEQLSFGAGPIGGLWQKLDDAAAEQTARTAYDAGLRLFDTSPFYGSGLSEYRVGHALRQLPRDSYVISTKVGRWFRPHDPATLDRGSWTDTLDFIQTFDYSYDGIMRSVEQSHLRLATHRIDILLIHDADRTTHGDGVEAAFKTAMDSGYRALDELRRNGDVKAIGVGVNEADMCARFARAGDFDCMLLAGRYTLYEQDSLDDFMPLAVEKNIGLLIGGAFNSGILATGPTAGATYNYQPAPSDVRDRIGRIEAVCARHEVPLAAAAIQFTLGHPAVSTVTIGMAKPERIAQNLALMRHPIPADLWADLKAEGLLRDDAPAPVP